MKDTIFYKAGSKIPYDVIPVTPKSKKYLNKFGVDVIIEYKDDNTISIFPINELKEYDKIIYLDNCRINIDELKKVYVYTYPKKVYEMVKDICDKYNIKYNNKFIDVLNII